MSEAAAVYLQIDDLVPWSRNPRINAQAIEAVMRSIERFGFAAPIIARSENHEIVAGHTRWEAAKRLGMTTVPVRLVDLSEEEAHALAVADNRLGEIADWDAGALEEVLRELQSYDKSVLDVIGWADELDTLLDDMSSGDSDDSGTASALEYRVVVSGLDEQAQRNLIERLEAEGLSCQALIS